MPLLKHEDRHLEQAEFACLGAELVDAFFHRIPDKDDGSWKEGKPIQLFNGKDITGWTALNPSVEMKRTVQDGILRNAPPTTDIISTQNDADFSITLGGSFDF